MKTFPVVPHAHYLRTTRACRNSRAAILPRGSPPWGVPVFPSPEEVVRSAILIGLALLLSASPAIAQKHCTKGIPCGNTCIPASKTCRVGAGTATRFADPRPAASVPADPAAGPFVASSRGNTYYRTGCSAARKLAPANRIYFKSAEEAEIAGYRPSRSRECS